MISVARLKGIPNRLLCCCWLLVYFCLDLALDIDASEGSGSGLIEYGAGRCGLEFGTAWVFVVDEVFGSVIAKEVYTFDVGLKAEFFSEECDADVWAVSVAISMAL